MFLLRSAFWLTVAFIVVRPPGTDLGAAATSLSGQAMAAGQRIVVEQILKSDCTLSPCRPAAPPRVVVGDIPLPSAGSPMQDSPAHKAAPVPRPRPHWMG
jgi:hypothetical protein